MAAEGLQLKYNTLSAAGSQKLTAATFTCVCQWLTAGKMRIPHGCSELCHACDGFLTPIIYDA